MFVNIVAAIASINFFFYIFVQRDMSTRICRNVSYKKFDTFRSTKFSIFPSLAHCLRRSHISYIMIWWWKKKLKTIKLHLICGIS
jgi:hypothetical protein